MFKKYIEKRFGITLPEYVEIEERGRVRLFSKSVKEIERVEIMNKGINAGRNNKGMYKPSTDFLQVFGFMATRNIVFLKKEEIGEFMKKRTIKIENELNADNGYVVIFYRGKAIGCGLLKEGNILENNIPKYRRFEE